MSGRQVRFRVLGIDCAHDAARVEHDVLQLSRVRSASVSAATHVLTLELDEGGEADVDRVVSGLGYHLEPFDNNQTPATAPAYRRALIVVVVLNLTFGVAEMAGGFVSGSQALKADALDFIGDGLITMLAVIAIGWRMIWRARAAFLQGVFLGLLGLSVLATAAFRLVGGDPPEPEIMGGLGVVALVVNIGAAAVLVPHRQGDANVRAVWLFSRNDALANVAVIGAAGAVAWTGQAWPDIAVAVAIAALFLHSAISIVRHAARDAIDQPREDERVHGI